MSKQFFHFIDHLQPEYVITNADLHASSTCKQYVYMKPTSTADFYVAQDLITPTLRTTRWILCCILVYVDTPREEWSTWTV